MRYAFLALFLLTPIAARADDAAVVKELLDKATKAQGGADKVAKLGDLIIKGKGTVMEGGQTVELTYDLSIRGIDSARADLSINAGGMTNKALLVIADGKMWTRDANQEQAREAPDNVRPAIMAFLTAIRSPSMLSGLAGRKDVTMTHGGEAKVDDTPVDVLRIVRKDLPDTTVYIDKKTGHPIKSETPIKEPDGGEEKTFAFHFSDFKAADGATIFHKIKIVRDGKEMIELEFTEVKPGAKFEANTFEKP